jgi:predicted transglutaminase-like cysteine proteinase
LIFKPSCEREPKPYHKREECRGIDRAREAELKAVNLSVNRQIEEWSDFQASGKVDFWEVAFHAKPTRRLCNFIISASDRRALGGVGHTVLTVRVPKGDKALDNRTGIIRDRPNTPYEYFVRAVAISRWEMGSYLGGRNPV